MTKISKETNNKKNLNQVRPEIIDRESESNRAIASFPNDMSNLTLNENFDNNNSYRNTLRNANPERST